MEVVSVSNLVFSRNRKTTAACDFLNMVVTSFVMSHDFMRDQLGSYAYMQI